jgi:hypothetical protein
MTDRADEPDHLEQAAEPAQAAQSGSEGEVDGVLRAAVREMPAGTSLPGSTHSSRPPTW